ncbi:host attachment protein [Massilia soli]|uniref:Host attachment protein n=1 Tax=Massilia soli TaxID=2792854 RepID=A0ABS7SI38_9BURK|nr:host attachment protein [Massilia soli]MBZ2205707.1 host attachment protein [Massilia soli]
MDTVWIVSANAGRARIFAESKPDGALQEVDSLVNTSARMRVNEKYTDRIGPLAAGQSSHNTGGALPSTQYEPQQTPDEREAEAFAKDVSARLVAGLREGQFQKLSLVAAPKFLGVLRSVLDPELKQLVNLELDKDYTQSNAQQLREQLQAQRQ